VYLYDDYYESEEELDSSEKEEHEYDDKEEQIEHVNM
jgi:hypothetical protein